MNTTNRTTVRFNAKDKELIEQAKEQYGITHTIGVIRLALRMLLHHATQTEANEQEKKGSNNHEF